MVPRLATAGASFQGAFLYYCHDKKARTTDRVAWTETVNIMTKCCEKAWKVMTYTAKVATRLKRAAGKKRAGDQIDKPVISWSLSWHPEQKPDKDTMLSAAKETIAKLGLSEHEAMIVAHRDEPQPHVHIIINRIHPLTGMAANLFKSKRKLQSWAREFQRKEGTMYCPKREENHQKRKKGQQTKYVDPIINEAWQQSHDAVGFALALERNGYRLARGRKRLVVVDTQGKAIYPVRHIEGIRVKEFHERMATIDQDQLPTPEELTAERQSTQEQQGNHLKDYEERAATAFNDLAQKHVLEWDQTTRRHASIIGGKRAELIEFYKINERQSAIDKLEKKLNPKGRITAFMQKLFRRDRRIKRQIGELQATQYDAKQRLDEAIGKLIHDRDCDLQLLENYQEQDRKELTDRLEKWRPSEHRTPRRVSAPSHEPRRQQEGPTLGR